jgi:hypothetical protein
MVRPADGGLRLLNRVQRNPFFEVVLRTQNGKLQLGDVDTLDLMPSIFGAFGIFVSQRMSIVPHGRVRMALDDDNMLRHAVP